MDVTPFGELTPGLGHTGLDRGPGRLAGDQTVAARTDQVRSTGRRKRLAYLKIIVWFEKLEQGPLQLAIAQMLGDEDLLRP